jgi:broad specificity phosphatase PhoE
LAKVADQPILYVVRHGNTDLNAGNSFRGFKDVELDETGRAQARAAFAFLRNVHFVAAYSSDLKRATETLDILISGDKGLMPERLCALRPWNIGKLAGQPKSAANRQALAEYVDNPDEPVPGGESLSWFRSRYKNVFQDIVSKPGPTLVVQHASNDHELGNILYGDIDALDVDPGGIIGVYRTPRGLEGKILMGKESDKEVAGFVS